MLLPLGDHGSQLVHGFLAYVPIPQSKRHLDLQSHFAEITLVTNRHLQTSRQDNSNKSVFSYIRMLTTWHCPHSHAAAAANRSTSPARRAHSSSKLAAAGLLLWTDSRTAIVPFRKLCSAYYAGSANKVLQY